MKKIEEKLLCKLMQNDTVGRPKQEVEDRLFYTFMLKNSSSKLTQNSFAGFIHWIFSTSGIGIKAAALSFLLVISLMNTNFKQNDFGPISCDSTFVEKVLVLDSTNFYPEITPNKNDTLF